MAVVYVVVVAVAAEFAVVHVPAVVVAVVVVAADVVVHVADVVVAVVVIVADDVADGAVVVLLVSCWLSLLPVWLLVLVWPSLLVSQSCVQLCECWRAF